MDKLKTIRVAGSTAPIAPTAPPAPADSPASMHLATLTDSDIPADSPASIHAATPTSATSPTDSFSVQHPEFERVGHYLADHARFLADLPGYESPHLRALRREGIARFNELGFPTPRQEAWRHTNVAPIAATAFRRARPAMDEAAVADAVARYAIDGTYRLVFVNGRFAEKFSQHQTSSDGVYIGSLATALADPSVRTVAEAHLGRYARFDEHPFVALNTAFIADGAFVHVPRGTVVDRPIHLLFLAMADEGVPTVHYPRNLIVIGEAGHATIVETYAGNTGNTGNTGGTGGTGGMGNTGGTGGTGTGVAGKEIGLGDGLVDSATLCCAVTELVAGPGSVVDHYKVQDERTTAFHMATLQVYQDRASSVSSHSVSTGGRLVRHDVNAILDGEGADCILNGLYLVTGEQHVGNYMRVEHVKPHCTSHELYKGILDGRSRAVFSGLIYVHPGAQKTDAKQSNRNLLLSKEALVNSNPQLEIFANDVKCTHGSTVGQLDEDAVYYLRSRGIGVEAAKSLLIYAFASDIVERIKVEAVRRDLEEFLFGRLPMGDVVRQAV